LPITSVLSVLARRGASCCLVARRSLSPARRLLSRHSPLALYSLVEHRSLPRPAIRSPSPPLAPGCCLLLTRAPSCPLPEAPPAYSQYSACCSFPCLYVAQFPFPQTIIRPDSTLTARLPNYASPLSGWLARSSSPLNLTRLRGAPATYSPIRSTRHPIVCYLKPCPSTWSSVTPTVFCDPDALTRALTDPSTPYRVYSTSHTQPRVLNVLQQLSYNTSGRHLFQSSPLCSANFKRAAGLQTDTYRLQRPQASLVKFVIHQILSNSCHIILVMKISPFYPTAN
jgi:hypothetical protein